MDGKWHVRAVCKCGWHTNAPFGMFSHIRVSCCPECAALKPDGMHYDMTNNWSLCVMRFVSESKWWNPMTWSKGYWENKEKQNP